MPNPADLRADFLLIFATATQITNKEKEEWMA